MSDNKRLFPRVASLIRCGVIQTSLSAPCPARIINKSAYGLMLELDYPLEVGSPIKIFIADEITGAIDYETKHFLFGVVRWCAVQKESWTGLYQAGVEIVTQAPRRPRP